MYPTEGQQNRGMCGYSLRITRELPVKTERNMVRCLGAGEKESALMPLDETICVLETMDEIRAGWGLRYPGEGVGP